MKFNIISSLENKVYTVQISASLPTEKEIVKAEQFGPIKVDAGGNFEGPPLFTVPPQTIIIDPRSMPFSSSTVFNGNTDTLASKKASFYINEMQRRITASKQDWDSQYDIVNSVEFTLNLN